LAHQELAGKVIGARGGPVAAQSAAADSGSCRRNGDGGGDSGRSSPIPSARRWREVRRSCGLARRRPGWRGTARLTGGHGGSSVSRRFHGRVSRKRRKKGEKEEGFVALERDSRTSSRPSLASRRWPRRSPASLHAGAWLVEE
jgi:hypothetical protein